MQYRIGITFEVEADDERAAYDKVNATIDTLPVEGARTWGPYSLRYIPRKGDLVRVNDKLGRGYHGYGMNEIEYIESLRGQTLAITRLVRRPGQSKNVAAEVVQLKGSRRNLVWTRDITPAEGGN